MELLVSHLILSVVVGVSGLCAGWWLHTHLPAHRSFVGQNDEGLIRELLSSLHTLSNRVAADVNAHNTTVGAVDRELERNRPDCAAKVGDLVDRLISANRQVQSKLTETEGKLDQLSHKMEHHAAEARTDVLTGLPNRRAFQEEAARLQAESQADDVPVSLVMIDIDRFKQVNDVHGHPFGDDVLHGVGEILRGHFRGCDIVTRFGGEEFAVLMRATRIADARRAAETVREIIEQTRFDYSGKALGLTVSMGIAESLPDEEISGLIKRADQAMYAAKHAGRNRVYWHDGTLPHPLRSPQSRSADMGPEVDGVLPLTSSFPQPVPELVVPSVQQQEAMQPASDPPERSAASQPGTLQAADIDMEVLGNLGTKTMFCQLVHRRIAEFHRGGSCFSALLLQVDRKDDVVRSYGAAAWEAVLGVVAQSMRKRLREMDFVARYDDETFGMVLPDASLRNAICVAERLRKAMDQTTLQFEGTPVAFTVSLGVVEATDSDEMATLVERARSRLAEARQQGGNRTGFSSAALVAS